jgi:hypothetical protein
MTAETTPAPPRPLWAVALRLLAANLLCLVLVVPLTLRFVPWPFSVGIPLILQFGFFLIAAFALARRTALNADYPAYRGRSADNVIATMDTTRRALLRFDFASGGFNIIVAIAAIIMAGLQQPGPVSSHWIAITGTCLAFGFALIVHGGTLANRRPAYEYAAYAGTSATATINAIHSLGFSKLGKDLDSPNMYQFDLEVHPAHATSYRAVIEQPIRLRLRQLPPVGTVVRVNYLPERPDVVVILTDLVDRPISI